MAPADPTLAHAAPEPEPEAPVPANDEWAQFFTDFYERLLAAGVLFGRSRQDAEDAVHHAMISVRANWYRIENPAAYAHRIVIRYVTTTQWRRREDIKRSVMAGQYLGDQYDHPGLAAVEQEPWVRQLIDRLPAAQRAVMAGLYQGLSPAELAAQLGQDSATLRKNLQYARVRLRRELQRQRARDSAYRDSAGRPHSN